MAYIGFHKGRGAYVLKNLLNGGEGLGWCGGGLVVGLLLGANCVWFALIHLMNPH